MGPIRTELMVLLSYGLYVLSIAVFSILLLLVVFGGVSLISRIIG